MLETGFAMKDLFETIGRQRHFQEINTIIWSADSPVIQPVERRCQSYFTRYLRKFSVLRCLPIMVSGDIL